MFPTVRFSQSVDPLCSLTAHSDLGIGGLQFGGQQFSAGVNGAGQYGWSLLCCCCIPPLTENTFQRVTASYCLNVIQVMVEATMVLLVMENQLGNMVGDSP